MRVKLRLKVLMLQAVCGFGWGFGDSLALADDPVSDLAKADLHYTEGNCSKAIPIYEDLDGNSQLPVEGRDRIVFRRAYCYFTLGDFESAEAGFQKVLQKYPQSEEARLRYAQSLFGQSKGEEARSQADQIKSDGFRIEAQILLVQIDLADGALDEAFALLQAVKSPGDWLPVVDYWKGIVKQRLDEEEEAQVFYTQARDEAPAQLWVKAASEARLQELRDLQQRFHVTLSGGFLYDGNVAQSGGYSQQNQSNSTQPGSASITFTNYASQISDRGYLGILNTTWTPVRTGSKFQLFIGADLYTTFYQTQTSYNYESINTRMEIDWKMAPPVKFTLGTNYLDTRYAYLYYQDYLGVTPGLVWNLSSVMSVTLSVPLTFYMTTRPSTLVGPTLIFQERLSYWTSFYEGFNVVNANGQPAQYSVSSGVASVSSGTEFSRYLTYGGYLGFGSMLPLAFNFYIQGSLFQTNYASESNPLLSSVSGGVSARSDLIWGAQASLNHDMGTKAVNLGVSATYTSDQSTGYSGVGSSGYLPIDSYDRIYGLVSLALKY